MNFADLKAMLDYINYSIDEKQKRLEFLFNIIYRKTYRLTNTIENPEITTIKNEMKNLFDMRIKIQKKMDDFIINYK